MAPRKGNGSANGKKRGRQPRGSEGLAEEHLRAARRHLGVPEDGSPAPGVDPARVYARSEEELACEYIDEAHRARQPLAEKQMEHAAVWKRAKESGVHTGAAQLVAKLERMSPEKAADYLRAFDRYRAARGTDDKVGLADLVTRMEQQSEAAAPV